MAQTTHDRILNYLTWAKAPRTLAQSATHVGASQAHVQPVCDTLAHQKRMTQDMQGMWRLVLKEV